MGPSLVLRVSIRVSVACLLASPMVACRQENRASAPAPSPIPSPAPQGQAKSPEPIIELDSLAFDYGLANEGDTLKHVFTIRNTGTAPLVLSNALSSCGCTAAILSTTTIPPGGSGALEVTTDTHGDRGPVSRRITVFSNDPHHPASTIEIKYEVEPLLHLERSFVQLSAPQGSARVERVWLSGQLVKQAKLRLEVEGTNLVTARAIETRENGQLHKGLQLRLHGKSRASGDGVVTIETGLSKPSKLSLPFAYAVD
jgi:hypothetical protein